MKVISNSKGFTLIELIISIGLTLIILTFLLSSLSFSFNHGYGKLEDITHMRNTRFALNYIEKRLREMDQMSLVYDCNLKTFEGITRELNDIEIIRWVDLSGYKRDYAFLYFNRPTKQLRVNLNNENNVLVPFIEDIKITEINSANLIEIEVFSSKIEYSVKSRFHINHILRNEI